ncbi:porin [Vibrio bathopelagicus]|uniref:porin n=1 Tax=Vibrio bathopelagicus TaxID=2777577 RepID=UPI001863B026|nr:porin [Vibrio bathopelagicus]MBY7730575.1 porin [Vibrio splendidus]
MNNKTLIALAVAATVSAGANAANVYSQDGTELNVGGRAEFRGDFIGNGGEEVEGTMANNSRFRLNVGGTTEINESLSGFGFYEAEQTVNSSSDNDANDTFKQRYMFAGLQGEFGAVSFGRQDTAAVQISQMSDVTTFTGAQKEFISAGNEQINNTILYTGEFDALTVKASLVAGEKKDTDSYGVSAIYTLPMGLGFGLGYSAGDNGENLGSGDAIIAGVNYTLDSLYLAGTYTTGEADDKLNSDFNGMEFAATYGFGNGFTLMGAYQKTEVDNLLGQSSDQSDFFEITGDYAFNNNMNAYVAYMLNNMDESTNGAKDAEDTLRLGLKYSF